MNSTLTKVKTRTILSAIFFGVFLASAIGIAIASRQDLRYYVMIPFIGAYLFLPRKLMLKTGDDEEVKMAGKINLWLSYLRIIYFAFALFVLLALPKII